MEEEFESDLKALGLPLPLGSTNLIIQEIRKWKGSVSPAIMFSVGVFGNVLALIVLHKSPGEQKRKLFYRFVAGLTITDLMRGLSGRKNSFTESRTFSGYSRRFAECQMAVLLIGITVVFNSCYLPLIIRIVLNQTKLLPVNMRTDLLVIRFASLNQILDPWVYILLRREVVSRLIFTIRKPLSPKTTEVSQKLTAFPDTAG
ncbi:prostaglandin E2 receptor EP4 subtype-like [Dreissena polymorpha]|uniref:prostaglandin E2 receptor EP4 subtype-like n=1 Tax=Dreissena polymorpha TaxID=45954 RepID=UPI0022649EEF|nr:prostaglandin E2 receptor EP4 subtype-like [Dreissena polymorpha]